MEERAEIKSKAMDCLKRTYKMSVLVAFMFMAINGIASLVSGIHNIAFIIISILIFIFVCLPLSVLMDYHFLLVCRGKDPDIMTILFNKEILKNYTKYLLGILWMCLWITLWSLLFVIPGIIKAISYSMTPYILADNPDIGAKNALNLSKRMTVNHKTEIFIFTLSFIGWLLLSYIAVNIINLVAYFAFRGPISWVTVLAFSVIFSVFAIPYLMISLAGLYDNIKEHCINNGTIDKEELSALNMAE